VLRDEETLLLAERAASAGGYASSKAYITHLIWAEARSYQGIIPTRAAQIYKSEL